MDEMWGIFPKTRDVVDYLHNLHPSETIFSKNSLELSGLVSMTNQSFVHYSAFMNTISEEDKNIRFEL